MRLINGEELYGIESLLNTEIILNSPEAAWLMSQVLHDIQASPTIDPETLPIVRQLREELAQVTAERDAAVKDLETAMRIDSEADDIGLSCFLCHVCIKNDTCDGACNPKWRGQKKDE